MGGMIIAQLLKKWGYTGFGLSVTPYFHNSVSFFCVTVFSGTNEARILKRAMGCCIVGLRIGLIALILPFICLFYRIWSVRNFAIP